MIPPGGPGVAEPAKSNRIRSRRGRLRAAVAVLLASASSAGANSFDPVQPFAPYSERSEFMPAVPGAHGGLYGFVNPAVLTHVRSLESTFAWSDRGLGGRNEWGMFTALPRIGFGLLRQSPADRREAEVDEYRLAFSGGERAASFGAGFGWGRGPRSLRPESLFSFGSLLRPSPHLSLGFTWTSDLRARAREAAVDVGVRPLGSPRLTLFADAAMANDRAGGDRFWSAGAAVELWYGLAISARYRDDGVAALGLRLGLGESAVQTGRLIDLRDDGGESSRGLYSVSLAGFQGDGFAPLKPRRPRYLHLKLDGPVRYRRHALFDRSRTLLSLLSLIERARTDPGIRGVALNLSGIRIGYENSWELRQQLQALRDDGKRVVVYIDHAGLRLYHLASVADRILFDPSGLLMLEGFVAGGTYLKGALDRIGVGVEELRYREYKSALEPLVRDSMSAEDREQWQAFVDDVYASARADIAAARGLEMEEVDRLVDEVTLFLPEDARGHGLVDTLARWDAVDAAIESLEGRPVAKAGPASIAPRRDRSWGEPPRLAVLYALGVCAMDTGIGARRLVADIERVREDGRVKAVVLRVDSPGGEVLASDLVADAVRRLKEEKPVIVSQGAVAASGGYWISMYADSIVAAPVTLTGSIGVIYGWFYNRGLKEKLGLATDHVRAGARADLPFGMELPLLGTLPDRNLRDDERAIVSAAMRATYDRFVGEVASARGQPIEAIEAVAKGRIWSGSQALEAGLVDELGGLMAALRLARERAGLKPDRPVVIDEHPRLGLIDWDRLAPSLIGQQLSITAYRGFGEQLLFRLERRGQPLLLGSERTTSWYMRDGRLAE